MTIQEQFLNQPTNIPDVNQDVIQPAVLTSKTAVNDLTGNVKPGYDQALTDIQNQSAKNLQTKVDSEQKAANELTAQQYAQRSGVDVSRIVSNPNGGFMVGPETKDKAAEDLKKQLADVIGGATYNTADYNLPTSAKIGDNGTVIDQNGNPIGNAEDYKKTTPETFDTSMQGITDQFTQASKDVTDKLNQIANGTFPLTPDQQAQLDSLKQQYLSVIKQQETTNANYTGGITNIGISSGRSRYAPELAQGEIQAAISAGTQKIADLNSQMASALAQMKQGFMDNNFKMISQSWDIYQQSQKMISDNLKSMNDAALAAKKMAQDEVHQNLQDAIASEKLTNDEKQQLIDNAFKQGQIDEDKRHNLVTEAQEQAKIDLQKGIGGNGQIMPTVSITGTGLPSKAEQAAFLDSLPDPQLATTIKAIAEYRQNPNSLPTRNYRGVGGLTQAEVLAYVNQYDPTWSQQNYASRQSLITNFTSGAYSKNINALNTATGHLSSIADALDKLGNVNFLPYNITKNAWASVFGGGPQAAMGLNLSAVSGELAAVFKNSGATDPEIANIKAGLSNNSTPDAIKGYIEKATELLSSRLQALNDTYTMGMGKPKDPGFLSPTSQQHLLDLQQKGYTINVPELANNPTVKLSALKESNPDTYNQIKTLMPNATPQEVVDYLENLGIIE